MNSTASEGLYVGIVYNLHWLTYILFVLQFLTAFK